MPGYLGDQKNFGSYFRQAIEKNGDRTRQAILSQKVRPFLLRRTKVEVAKELPAKTIMIESVQLDGAQRDLYETVRLTMHEKVKEEILLKGFKRSQIAILEALLRLRQVCCDPRLIGTKFKHKAKDSSKLRRVLDMVSELVDEGRKILIFSQFTSMLDIIAAELLKLKVEFVQIRGDTKDRSEPVRRFQNGEVPVFLLSLKAGGTGLNLTAADTVIHYDPWWNPAVENQATDRAHRIGQTKPVFVYKAIATGTIEERMLQLQEKKKALAEGVFDERKAASINITEEELEYLFRPLSDEPKVEEDVATYSSETSRSSPILLLPLNEDESSNEEEGEADIEVELKVEQKNNRPRKHLEVKAKKQKNDKHTDKNENSDKDQTTEYTGDPFIDALRKQGLSVEDIVAGEFMKRKK
jgi:SNF2 family DNA or RNA helicase